MISAGSGRSIGSGIGRTIGSRIGRPQIEATLPSSWKAVGNGRVPWKG
jgi:hypothetical protein